MSDDESEVLDTIMFDQEMEHERMRETLSFPKEVSPFLSEGEDYETKKQDAEHRIRFERYLLNCGVKRQPRVHGPVIMRGRGGINYEAVDRLFEDPDDLLYQPDFGRRDTDSEDSGEREDFDGEEEGEEERPNERYGADLVRTPSANLDADEYYVDRTSHDISLPYIMTTLDRINSSNYGVRIQGHPVETLDILNNADRDSEYVLFDKYIDRRNSVFSNDEKESEANSFPKESNEGYIDWEVHDKTTLQEIGIAGNGGTYDAFRPDFWKLDENLQYIVKLPPGEKFKDCLDLNYFGLNKIKIPQAKKFKNNLTACSNKYDYLFTCTNSEIAVFDYDFLHKVSDEPILRFDTRPTTTLTRDRLVSTWPYFPHTINYCKVDTFNDREILAVAVDDGKVLAWYVDSIHEQVLNYSGNKGAVYDSGNNNNRFFGLKLAPAFQLTVESSAWGVDFYNEKNLIVVSDNSQSISLFYYSEIHDENRLYHVETHQVLHNIPDVSFIKDDINRGFKDGIDTAYVSCASISGELVIFKFVYYIASGPLPKPEPANDLSPTIHYDILQQYHNSGDPDLNDDSFLRIHFKTASIVSRNVIDDDCWTSKFIDGKWFKPVQSIRAAVGDPWINEDKETNKISNQSKILDGEVDPVQSSDLGIAAKLHFFESPMLSLNNVHSHRNLYSDARFGTVTDQYRRMRKIFDTNYLLNQRSKKKMHKSKNNRLYWPNTPCTQLDNKFLAVSTSKRLGLFRCDRLFCVSGTKKVFDVKIPHNEETKYANRISITQVIPELSAFVAVTQAGMVTIMRLCCHRGIYGMRQEHIFPNASAMALGESGYRTISGLGVRKINGGHQTRYILYVVYDDGITLTYELKVKDDEFSSMML